MDADANSDARDSAIALSVIRPGEAKMALANSADPDQTAPEGAV